MGIKNNTLIKKNAKAFENILCDLTTLHLRLHALDNDIKLASQHLGGNLANLPNGNRSTIDTLIVSGYNK